MNRHDADVLGLRRLAPWVVFGGDLLAILTLVYFYRAIKDPADLTFLALLNIGKLLAVCVIAQAFLVAIGLAWFGSMSAILAKLAGDPVSVNPDFFDLGD